MARQIVFVDDITGETGAETVSFGWDGRYFNIDLTMEGRDELESLLAPYLHFGQDEGKMELGGRPKKPTASLHDPDHGKHSREELDACTAWASEKKLNLNERGRIPADVWRAWRQDDVGLLRPGRLPGTKPTPRQELLDDIAAAS